MIQKVKQSTLFLLFILVMILTFSCNRQDEVGDLIQDIQDEYVPDKRLDVFSIFSEKKAGTISLYGETSLEAAKSELLLRLSQQGISIRDYIRILPDSTVGEKTYAVISVPVANFRSQAKHSAELVTQIILGHPLRLLKKEENWYYAKAPDGYLGWIDKSSCQPMNEQEFSVWQNKKKLIYLKPTGYCYSFPDKKSPIVSDVSITSLFPVSEKLGHFYQVTFADGREGWIDKAESEKFNLWINQLTPYPQNIIQTAFLFFGSSYLWGGTSAYGTDCSGFTKTVYFLNGIMLPRDASQQVRLGDVICTSPDSLSQLKPGDLLFFGRVDSLTHQEKITHVGLYTGKGNFIHQPDRVRIESLNPQSEHFSDYRYNTFRYGKRIINNLENHPEYLVINHPMY